MQDLTSDVAKAALAALAGAKPFRNVPEEARRALYQSGRMLTIKEGALLFQHGEPGGSMFVVVSGLIEVSVLSPDGRKVSLNRLGPGQCFGEISMVDGLPRTADTMALAETKLLSFGRDAFFANAQRFPELALAMVELLCERVRWLSDSVEDYAILPLERRLARRLLMLFERFGNEAHSIEIAQMDLADFVGATRESVNKILVGWRNRNLIAMGRKSLKLLDHGGLTAVADMAG